MKIAIVYNRDSRSVINLFGVPNREKYGLKNIKRIVDSLKQGGHQVVAFEGDKDLIDRLEEFMPRALKGERPGMVFNLSYGIQGQARYTHVPGMLEMVGIPYVGSGPLAHSLALDKVVAKMIFKQRGIPTPDFVVLDDAAFDAPDLAYPLIVKPKNEAVSFGIKIVNDENELREAAGVIFDQFAQPVLAEQYIEGREVNVGILGNSPAEALPPAELTFSEGGPAIYTYEDKTKKSGREVGIVCPAQLDPELTKRTQEISIQAFHALGCYDCARVDLRIDRDGNPYILEINSLPSLGQHGSYPQAAQAVGLDFAGLINRLVEVAAARYFGTPTPPRVDPKTADAKSLVFSFLTQRRDRIERRTRDWVARSGRTSDPVGLKTARAELIKTLRDVGLQPNEAFTDDRVAWTWETPAGFAGGALLIVPLDVPLPLEASTHAFRRDPEWLYGEGIASSRASIVMMESALRALRHARKLKRLPLGVLFYSDEGQDCRYSADVISGAARAAGEVLSLRCGNLGDRVITARRGQRKFQLIVEGKPLRLGQATKRPQALLWAADRLGALAALSSRKERVAVSATSLSSRAFPFLVPHHVTASVLLTYPTPAAAEALEEKMREVLGKGGVRWSLELVSDRPPMVDRKVNQSVLADMRAIAEEWDIPFDTESSVWASPAGLVPEDTGVICGLGPVAADLHTPQEAVQRISLMQRTLLLAQYLGRER